MRLHFEVHGQGEPLVILHGLLGSLDNWRPTAAALGRHFEVFSLDQRNHGSSPHSFEMNYAVMAQDVVEFLDSRGLRDAFVLGHSMGGKTAMHLALHHPAMVRKLVVADMALRAYAPSHHKTLTGMLAVDLGHFQSRKEIEAALAPAVPEVTTRQFLVKNLAYDQERKLFWKIGLNQILLNYSRLIEPIDGGSSFQKPTLFVRGENSNYLVEEDLPAIRLLFPLASLKVIRGAGHLLQVESPSTFQSIVLEFLRAA